MEVDGVDVADKVQTQEEDNEKIHKENNEKGMDDAKIPNAKSSPVSQSSSPDGSESIDMGDEEEENHECEKNEVESSSLKTGDNEESNNDDDDEDEDNSEEESDEDDDEEDEKKVPTDEYGRELSAYEIMRLERIKRNKAYLAQLGLEEEKKRANESKQKEIEEKRKERRKKQQMIDEALALGRRQSMARKSKTKEVDYSGDLKNVLEPVIKQKKEKKKKVNKSTKKDESLPRFIYLEFEHIKKRRNKAVATGKRLVRAAELEVRVAKKNLEIHERREKRKIEKEERRVALQTKRMLEPIVRELDIRRIELQKARKKFEAWEQRASLNLSENKAKLGMALEQAEKSFPISFARNECMLWNMLHERLYPESNDSEKAKKSVGKGKKRKREINEEEKKEVPPGEETSSNPGPDEPTRKLNDSAAPSTKKSNQLTKARNVGGPVTNELASSVQRKWLERDVPVPADISTNFLPQVGDIVLYYPCAHYDFLKDKPDIRRKKLRLALRKPLWERAEDEREVIKECKEKDISQLPKKAKSILEEKRWWTTDWIEAVHENSGAYPIICRVEKVVSEFPYDSESMKQVRRFKYKSKKEKEGKESDVKELGKGRGSRRLVVRKKPTLGVCVTLKPLSPISPPQRSRKKGVFFDKCPLSLPPTFSVLTFPCKKEPFIVPFFHAYRLSLSVSSSDRVKLFDGNATRQQAIVTPQHENQDCSSTTLELFTEIVQKDALADLSTLNRLDNFISNCYDIDTNLLNKQLPEADLRAIVAVALYQCHKRNITFAEITNDNKTSIDSKSPSDQKEEDPSVRIENLMNWIFFTLPRWKGVRLVLDENNTECFKSPWDFTTPAENDEDDSQEGILAAALAPSVLMTSPPANNGGFIYTLDDHLRSQIEIAITKFTETSIEAATFLRDPEKTAPEYCRFVPVSMTFRRILRRLKVHQMKNSKHNHDAEDPIESKSLGDSNDVCYYRSVGAIQADITDIYQNCLLYNDPSSEIVRNSLEITTFLKTEISNIESKWLAKKLYESSQARLAEMVAKGEDRLDLSTKLTSDQKVITESLEESFNGTLSRAYISSEEQSTEPLNSAWFPQCGDKIIYNRQLHGKFVNGHFSSLSKEQRVLPPILPRRKKVKNTEARSESAESSALNDNSKYHCWLGTVSSVRVCFPQQVSPDLQTFEMQTPILAIGVKFHYNWLSKDVHTVFWRPCHVGNPTVNSNKNCEKCGLSHEISFIQPAWVGQMSQLLPPYPMSLAKEKHQPTKISTNTRNSIYACLEALKERILNEAPIKTFSSAHPSSNDPDIPQRFKYIFDDEPDLTTKPTKQAAESSQEENRNNNLLKNAAYIPPWMLDEKLRNSVVTRASNFSTSQIKTSNGLIDGLIPNPYLCLDLIQRRIKSNYYHSLGAAAHDVREAFVCVVFYILKESILEKRIEKDFALKLMNHFKNSPMIDQDEEFSNERIGDNDLHGVVDFSGLKQQQSELFQRVELIRKVYSMALICVLETNTSILVLGVDKKEISNKQTLEEGPTEAQIKTKKTLSKILSSLSQDRCNFRKPLSKTSTLPIIKVHIIPPKSQPSEVLNGEDEDLKKPIVLKTDDFHNSQTNIFTSLFKHNERKVNVKITCGGKQYKKVIVCHPNDYSGNSHFKRIVSNPVKKSIKVSIKLNESLSSSTSGNDDKSDVSPTILDSTEPIESAVTNEEEGVKEEIDFCKPFLFKEDDYMANDDLIRALFCRPRRNRICVRCKLSRNGLFTCRVRKAHSNLDFVWNDFMRNIGGVDGLLKQMKPQKSLDEAKCPVQATNQGTTCDEGDSDQKVVKKSEEIIDENGFGNDAKGDEEQDEILISSGKFTYRELLNQAEDLLRQARHTLDVAVEDLSSKPCLSEDFLKSCDLLDPNDGHYEICNTCGLGGDVLCCESCPTVAHAKCAGLETIPNGDWYCDKCLRKKDGIVEKQRPDVGQLENELDKLRLMRQKDKIESKKGGVDDDTSTPNAKTNELEDGTKREVGNECIDGTNETDDSLILKGKRQRKALVRFGSANNESTPNHEMESISNIEEQKGNILKQKDSQQPKRKRGRPRKVINENNIPSESQLAVLNPVQQPRKRGRPRKVDRVEKIESIRSYTSDPPKQPRKRGRPRKIHTQQDVSEPLTQDTLPASEIPKETAKRKRGRPKKLSRKSPISVETLDWSPIPGCVDPSLTYYCTVENDTSVTIGRKLGTEWFDVANEEENIVRFPSLQNKRIRFRKGTLVRIPLEYNLDNVIGLKEES